MGDYIGAKPEAQTGSYRRADGVYTHPEKLDIPDVDLLTILFDPPYSTVPEDRILHASAERPSVHLNKAGLRRLVEEFAFGLRRRFGVGATGHSKDLVCLFSTGQVAYPAAYFGIIAAGGVASLATASCTAFELARQVKQGGAKVLICSEDILETAREATKLVEYDVALAVLRSDPDFSLRVDGEGEEGELRGKKQEDRLSWERITDPKELRESLVTLCYSSGTTGEPKGVMLSHDNFVTMLVVFESFMQVGAAMAIAATGVKPQPRRSLAHLPAAHIAGVTGYLLGPLQTGGVVFWMKKYRWDEFKHYCKALQISAMYTVPSIWLRIAKDPSVTDHFSSLQSASGGAAPLDGALQKAANKKLGGGSGQIKMGQAYGMTETSGVATSAGLVEKDETGSIGRVVQNTELRIVDEHDRDVAPGTPGELILRGRTITRGYFRNPKATAAAFRNGWFATGDIAVEREGKLYIVDRIKELIKYKGLQIAPAEIEGLLVTHPSVLEAAVVGVPDPSEAASETGAAHSEIPRAYVVKRPGSAISKAEVEAFVRDSLAPYKQLRGGVSFVEELPKNALNKLLRRELRERAIQEVKREQGARL